MTSRSDLQFATIFNATFGGYDCPTGRLSGVIDVRNNIFAVLPFEAGSPASQIRFGYCGLENFDFGVNWVSPGWTVHGGAVSGESNLPSPANNDPGFVGTGRSGFHLAARSSARRTGGNLAREVTSNAHNLDLTPPLQNVPHQRVEERRVIGPGSDMDAFSN